MNVVELSRLVKYVQILKNSVAYKYSAGERMFLVKDPAVEEEVSPSV